MGSRVQQVQLKLLYPSRQTPLGAPNLLPMAYFVSRIVDLPQCGGSCAMSINKGDSAPNRPAKKVKSRDQFWKIGGGASAGTSAGGLIHASHSVVRAALLRIVRTAALGLSGGCTAHQQHSRLDDAELCCSHLPHRHGGLDRGSWSCGRDRP